MFNKLLNDNPMPAPPANARQVLRGRIKRRPDDREIKQLIGDVGVIGDDNACEQARSFDIRAPHTLLRITVVDENVDFSIDLLERPIESRKYCTHQS